MEGIRMLRPALLALLLGTAAWSGALAQKPTFVQSGQRVRVHSALARTPELIGGVQAMSADTLVVRYVDGTGASTATAIPLAYISQLEVSRGQHSKWLAGLGIGLAAGATAGAILGASTGNDRLFSRGALAFLGAMFVAPIGGVTGLIVGALTKTETWETVPIPRVGKGVALGPERRIAVGVAVGF